MSDLRSVNCVEEVTSRVRILLKPFKAEQAGFNGGKFNHLEYTLVIFRGVSYKLFICTRATRASSGDDRQHKGEE